MEEKYLLEMIGITKRFPGTIALNDVDFRVKAGEVHLLMGENGAGKSTLLKTISGANTLDEGEMFLDGKKVHFSNPKQAKDAGIRIVYQELSLIQGMTVAQNLFLGEEVTKFGFVKQGNVDKLATEILNDLGVFVEPDQMVGSLTVGQQQMIEIARNIKDECKILILDEPTSALSESETQQLFRVVRLLKKRGVGVIYVSHRLEETTQIGDMVTVFKDGKVVGSRSMKDTTVDMIIKMMVGASVIAEAHVEREISEEVVLELRDVNRKGVLSNISLQLHKGEILGLAGLMGAGRSEVLRAIFGADQIDSGSILINGKDIGRMTPRKAVSNKIAFVPEDRKRHGLNVESSIRNNMTFPIMRKKELNVCRFFINPKAQEKICRKYIDAMSIKLANIDSTANSLSGGNQQKVVIGKWLATNSSVFLVDEPTRGIDVGAKREIIKILKDLANEGVSILLVDSETPELIELSDRILVMKQGEITAQISGREATHENLLKYSTVGGN